LEKAFRSSLTKASHGELDLLRRNAIAGEALLRSLGRLYSQHSLRDWLDRRNGQPQEEDYPKIVCSEALV
jgi:hypothetical protein